MSKKYLINIVGSDSKIGFNAVVKPRKDVETTLVRNGYEVINIPYIKDFPSWKRLPIHLNHILKAIFKIYINNPKEIIIQYPGMRVGSRAISLISQLLRGQNVTFLIHDIDSLRVYGNISNREVNTLNRAKKVIVHTENMLQYLRSHGVKTEMRPLWLFDYYADGAIKSKQENDGMNVVFAGNLSKSKFLEKFENPLEGMKLFLYGLPIEGSLQDGLEYKGKFAPDDISDIQGAWGLVWDGDSLDTCSGKMGNYLKYNSSHKAALYIASGKPIIVWDQSGIAPFIIKNNLGFTISSIRDIPAKLSNISDREYQEYCRAVSNFQCFLRNGQMLEHAIAPK